MEKPTNAGHSRDEPERNHRPESLGEGQQTEVPLEGLLLRSLDADPFQEVYAHMRELFAAVLKVAAPDSLSLQGDVDIGHQPVNQPAAQSVEQTKKELSLGEMSEAVSSPCDRAQASNKSDVTPLSHRQEVVVESHATLRNTENSIDVGHLGSDVSVGKAHDQVQNEHDKASVQSCSLCQEVPLDLNLQIARKLREFQAISKELEDLVRMTKAQTGTAEEKSRIEQEKIMDSGTDPCNHADPKNDEPTVSENHIKGHSDAKKTKFDASKVHKNPMLCVSEYWTWKLYSMCRELQVMCERVSSILPSTLEAFLVGGIANPSYTRPYLHLAEVTSLFIGFSSKLRSTVGRIMENISGSNIKQIAHLIFAIRELTTIFPLLETACRNLYFEYLEAPPPSDCHTHTGENKRSHAETELKMDIICHQMDVVYEQLGKAIYKINIIRDNEAASPEIPLCPLHPETDSEQVDPKEMFFIIARKLLLIEQHISSLMETRKFQGQAE